MNNLAIAGKVWVASDIHLGPHVPATARAFYQFLDEARANADALMLCGDIFDAWIGDDVATTCPPDWLAEALSNLRQVSASIPLWLGRGNRDFLLGKPFADTVGARMLPDVVCLDTDAGRVLLSHGDEYCTDDAGYQRFRRLVRNPVIQSVFLKLSLGVRRRVANMARKRSKASNQYKSAHIMDVSTSAVEQAFRDAGVAYMVHGHTHRPAIHALDIDGQPCQRFVLPDWDYDHSGAPRGGWLIIDENGLHLHQAPLFDQGPSGIPATA
ncbi:UDP-2,3-diacylglucosamine diphosphatase [Pusillimonas sp. ANT_WB101]|uniref:UDP-2,3-diacylglucosamine diphosphatase n=1 Tax=Pusillimonas sp. ANT_WB101 TaxID=2597356 RepID=UPI0011EE446B|nr:UDP-2,3-diacylglucosamine diphosphatase [Pusillimonas sp. ANT_WB101]KAA0910503.1 UDP-2,3-diacylglucosamine diphosphatase [Pusillimonas sp. ANT_WB101]